MSLNGDDRIEPVAMAMPSTYPSICLAFFVFLLLSMTSRSAHAQSIGSQGADSHVTAGESTWKETRDPNHCLADQAKCYNTGQCCPGSVCSTLDSLSPLSDDHRGVCVKITDPDMCSTSSECTKGQECVISGNLRYCHKQVREQEQEEESGSSTLNDPYHHDGVAHHMYQPHHRGGLGSACDNSTQCLPFTTDGADRLCCQDVRRGRQGTKRMCDRITQLSLCIKAQQEDYQ